MERMNYLNLLECEENAKPAYNVGSYRELMVSTEEREHQTAGSS